MSFRLRTDRVALGERLAPGWIDIEDRRIVATGTGPAPSPVDLDLGGRLVVPGFVDIHVHGGGGHSFQAGAAEAALGAAFHRSHGTTTMLASLVSAPIEELAASIDALAPLVAAGTFAGVHLEGPFLSVDHRGAHDPRMLRPPDAAAVSRLLAAGPEVVRMVTIAPELDGGRAAVEAIVAAGIVAAIGHTGATYEQAVGAIAVGASVATHLCNGMPTLHHRAPGPVLACLEAAGVAIELICDGVHLHGAVVHDTFRVAGPRAVLITDAISAAGVEEGTYWLGSLAVEVRNGEARLADGGNLAGSVLTLDVALRNAVSFGVPLTDALHALTVAPAAAIGLQGTAGVIAAGRLADLVVLDDDLNVTGVLWQGKWAVRPG
jgi:N-acetylglucosamine-6-phosphate deacetylase